MKKIAMNLIIVVLLLTIVGCGNNANSNSKATKNEETNKPVEQVKENNQTINSINDFETEVSKLGVEYTKTIMASEYIKAQEGIKLRSGDYKLEIYKFDVSTDAYKTAEKNQQITMDGFGSFNAIVKNGYALMIDEGFPKYNEIIEIFNKLK